MKCPQSGCEGDLRKIDFTPLMGLVCDECYSCYLNRRGKIDYDDVLTKAMLGRNPEERQREISKLPFVEELAE